MCFQAEGMLVGRNSGKNNHLIKFVDCIYNIIFSCTMFLPLEIKKRCILNLCSFQLMFVTCSYVTCFSCVCCMHRDFLVNLELRKRHQS